MIIQRYILRELLLAFCFAFAVVMAVGLLWMASQVLRAYEGLGLDAIISVLPMAAGYVAPWALLTAAGLAPTVVYGRLAADNEIVAMRVGGIPARRMIAPAVLFGVLLSGLGYAIQEHVQPAAHFVRRKMVQESALASLRILPPGRQKFQVGRYILSYLDARHGRMVAPYIVEMDGERVVAEYVAASGGVEFEGAQPRIVLSHPRVSRYRADGQDMHNTAAGDVPFVLQTADRLKATKGPDDMSRDELLEFALTTDQPRRRVQALTIYHVRYAQSAAPLLLVLVSVPIGIYVRKSSRLAGFGATLPPLITYLVLLFLFQGLGERGRIDPVVAAYTPDAVLAVAAAILMMGVSRK